MEGFHFFEPGTSGWDEAWKQFETSMRGELGQNAGRRTAYQSLKKLCREDNQAIPSESVKRLMQIVLEGMTDDPLVQPSKVLVGETWQYTGSFRDETGHWKHEFRHRHSDIHGGRAVFHFSCHTPVPVARPVSVPAGFVDNGDPF